MKRYVPIGFEPMGTFVEIDDILSLLSLPIQARMDGIENPRPDTTWVFVCC